METCLSSICLNGKFVKFINLNLVTFALTFQHC